MPEALNITRTPSGSRTVVHWRCPSSPQCTRGQIRVVNGTDAELPLLRLLEDFHQVHHAPGRRTSDG